MDRCDTPSPVGLLAPNGGIDLIAPVRINFGVSLAPVASVAVKVEQFSFVFVATHNYWILGVSATWLSQLYIHCSAVACLTGSFANIIILIEFYNANYIGSCY